MNGRAEAQLEFAYHMYGSDMGSLTVDLYVDGVLARSSIWSRSGQQSSDPGDWQIAVLDLSPYLPAGSIQLSFRADFGYGDLSDIAIDDLQVVSTAVGNAVAPTVLVDPQSSSVEAGESAYLSVIAEGSPSPGVQWYQNGAAIPGATGLSYYIPAVDGSAIGTYEAVISNSGGEVVSLPATLDVPGETPPVDPEPAPMPGDAYFEWAGLMGLFTGGPGGADVSGLFLDPDMDDTANLLEFAFGLDPLVYTTTGLPQIVTTDSGGDSYLEITYRRRIGGSGTTGIDYTVDDITYFVETTTNPNKEWTSGASEVVAVGSPVDNGDGTETVVVRRLTPIKGGSPVYLRVTVEAGFSY